jgi:hypothetical protein
MGSTSASASGQAIRVQSVREVTGSCDASSKP